MKFPKFPRYMFTQLFVVFCILLPHRRSTTVSLETTPSFMHYESREAHQRFVVDTLCIGTYIVPYTYVIVRVSADRLLLLAARGL